MDLGIEGKVAVVTGASRGIGRAIALGLVAEGEQPTIQVGGFPATEHGLRVGAESTYRQLASLTENADERVRLVDAANKIRPRTLR